MKKRSILILLLLISNHLVAQEKNTLISISYFAPYATNIGSKLGTSIGVKTWESTKRIHKLEISPQIGYFVQPKVQKNVLLDTSIDYKRRKSNRKSYLLSSLGLGYLVAIQNLGGTVDLATGNIDNTNTETIHYVVPTVNLGFGREPQKALGYFFKVFYGRKITPQAEDAAFFGLELGLNFLL